jgi:hypothetical protein
MIITNTLLNLQLVMQLKGSGTEKALLVENQGGNLT